MDMSLAEAAKLVFMTLAPIIATGAVSKIGEDITDTVKESLNRAWGAVEQRLKRPVPPAERAAITPQIAAIESQLAANPEASAAVTLYRARPENPGYQQIVVDQLVEVYKANPGALLALAQAIAALSPPPAAQRQHNQTISGNANVGTAIAGDLHGNLTIGSLDMSRSTSDPLGRPGRPQAAPAAGMNDPGGRPALPATLSADGVSFSYGHALIIGVGRYQQAGLSVPGDTTANDARALAALLRDPQLAAYPDDQVRVLVDARATRSNILDELEALARRAHGGTALIFFAGHGEPVANSYALLPYDTNLKDLAGTGITAELFHQRVAKVRDSAKRLVVLLNCCHAGGVGDAVLDAGAELLSGAAPPADFYQPLAVGSGQAVISSSRPSQKSGARSQADPQHTPFGAQLLAGLRGQAPGDGAGVGIFELFAHLRAQVPADARHIWYHSAPLRQEPLFYASQLDDNIALALRPGWQGGTLGDDTLSQARRLAELELAAEAGPLTEAQIAERDEIFTRLGQAR